MVTAGPPECGKLRESQQLPRVRMLKSAGATSLTGDLAMTRTFLAAVIILGVATGAAHAQANIEKGKQVYAAEKCQTCHSIGGVGNKKGPLDGTGTKLSADEIREWIVNAPAMTAKANATRKPAMKSYPNIAKDDLDALVAYLHSLKK
jgi:mono/diheme cytochrome c family protein